MKVVSRLSKKISKDRILEAKDVLDEVRELLQKDLEGLYVEMMKETGEDWCMRQAKLVGQAKATKNLISLITIGE
jgi:hypothetical protein